MTGGNREADAEKWERIYLEKNTQTEPPPEACRLLQDHRHLLPDTGDALDLACGSGGNALLLAGLGLHVTACDISSEACRQLAGRGASCGKKLRCLNADAEVALASAQRYDVITVSRFLDRSLTTLIERALRPGGLLFYQTFSVDAVGGPANPAYRLKRNELLDMYTRCSALRIVYYSEASLVTSATPADGQVGLIARRRF